MLSKIFKNFKTKGMVGQSSRFLIQKMISNIDFSRDLTIVQYGSGKAVFVKQILRKMSPNSKLYVFEIDEKCNKYAEKIDDSRLVYINDSAEKIFDYVTEKEVDAVVSTLPFASLPKSLLEPIITNSRAILKENGIFLQYQYFLTNKKAIEKIFGEKITKIETEIFELANTTFNVASPLQLSKVLFEYLALPTKGIKKSRTGFSTGQKELDKLRGLHPIIEKIEQFREFSKLKSTYVDALPKLADEKNRIHSNFAQDVTSTGRLSSTNPNLQNIPIRSKLGRKLRAGFIAKKGNILIAADYSQFELRLAAVLAGDQNLIEDFRSGADIHLKTAAMMFNLPENEISAEQRRAAKVINFGVLYGMSAHRLASELKINFAEAKSFIDNYFEVRKPIQNFINKTIKQAEEQGFVETLFGRRRPTPDVKSSNFMIREAAKRAAANMPIQGTEADLMKRAMIEVDKKITQAGLGEQILQIHDSILIEALIENAEQVSKILREIMEQVCPELDIPLKVDVKIGKSWETL